MINTDRRFDVVIFDLDGTLTKTEHRHHLIPPPNTANSDKSWDAFSLAAKHDPPQSQVVLLARMLYTFSSYFMIFSGRGEIARADTVKWLVDNDLYYDELVMRTIGDATLDDQLKWKWYNDRGLAGRDVIVFEDRQRVVDMWRRNGIRCFQVANGDF